MLRYCLEVARTGYHPDQGAVALMLADELAVTPFWAKSRHIRPMIEAGLLTEYPTTPARTSVLLCPGDIDMPREGRQWWMPEGAEVTRWRESSACLIRDADGQPAPLPLPEDAQLLRWHPAREVSLGGRLRRVEGRPAWGLCSRWFWSESEGALLGTTGRGVRTAIARVEVV